MSVYTVGVWTTREGCEQQFIEAWREMATRTQTDFPDATALLLRDRETPTRFISSGPWQSLDDIERWRNSPTFREGVSKIRDYVESFEPHTMDQAVAVGGQ